MSFVSSLVFPTTEPFMRTAFVAVPRIWAVVASYDQQRSSAN